MCPKLVFAIYLYFSQNISLPVAIYSNMCIRSLQCIVLSSWTLYYIIVKLYTEGLYVASCDMCSYCSYTCLRLVPPGSYILFKCRIRSYILVLRFDLVFRFVLLDVQFILLPIPQHTCLANCTESHLFFDIPTVNIV